ncbi:hypothetical protein [Cardiobacterium valvarum]|uniref:Predicted kinase n=1 Tax=Cardiobacterium valvarum TaxID=194702 RepID=A0A381EDQ0_9GAMM|nr:hypothetical protein [Cardiobacterium valvarum]SUX25171.1 Predicted kinase [Cardiobacterium valvarum]
MYILSALPGSGKDAHIRMHYRNLPILSLDDIRRAAGIDPTASYTTKKPSSHILLDRQ